MPNASVPKAPCVEVWLSPQTMVWPGLRDAEFRADDVHDALILAVHVKQANAGFAAVFLQRIKLELGVVVENRQRAVGGGDGMIHHRESEVGPADLAPFGAKPREGLGRSALMDEMAVYIDNRRLAGLFANDVGVPDFLVQRFGRIVGCHGAHCRV